MGQAVHVRVAGLADPGRTAEIVGQRVRQRDLVRERELDVDALDCVGVFAESLERDHHVFVDLERVGVARDRRGARAVAPERLACLAASRDESLARPCIGYPDDLGRGTGYRCVVVAHDVAEQHHLRQCAAARLGRVADGLEVALVEVFEAREAHAGRGPGRDVVADLDDGGNRIARVAEEFQADSAHVRGHPVQHPARTGDDPVATFFLHARQPAEKLVGDVLAEACLAEPVSLDFEAFGAQHARAVGPLAPVFPREFEGRDSGCVDAVEVVSGAGDLEPVALGVHHPPPGEIVERSAPQHGLFSAGIHGDVAAHARGIRRGRVHCEGEPGPTCRFLDATGDDAGLRQHRGHRVRDTGQGYGLHRPDPLELLGVDDGGERRERYRAARIPGAAATRDDGQPEFEAGAHQARYFVLGVGREHDERDFHSPVGGISRV